MIPTEAEYDPLIELSGRAHSGIPFYPPPFFDASSVKSDQQILDAALRRDKQAQALGAKLGIADWVAINQLTPLPIESWIGADEWTKRYGIHPLLKRAIAMEVDRLAAAIKSERSEAQRKLEMEKTQLHQQFNYGKPNSSFDKLFH